ncbi:MAG: TIM barrel protein, partial [Thermodesulfobacteriota bacterium]
MDFTENISIGCHVSTAGGLYKAVERAEETGCGAFQIFARNPRSWQVQPLGDEGLQRFLSLREKSGLRPLVVHTAYLINLSSPDELIFDKSL